MQKHGCVQPRERARVHVWPAAAVDATAPWALAGRFRTLSDAIGRYLRAGREGSTLMRWARAMLSLRKSATPDRLVMVARADSDAADPKELWTLQTTANLNLL